ncbi:winged helix-turn-helix transcriptional regulator [Endozoicomonas sp. SM1973]|uniref:Winged helix-turn-helix transcriptional regulator n=1 Tax=Spartinivicinus marinus TaxID=2994442 RepID=A0A853I921_9GAMM|nr:winged helix-turn-helix domain-containing protein [Spartinivicinus marinus]MCX4026832.1 winged helix-turn-helix domain-containing protein [Spartinivicinus marinus]NYZ69359.1 winged helix-turn-helix transcriptional regulator [Spartinivicinus marinus]
MGPDISFIASLIGDSARARMLIALMGGKALTATELSLEADITPQTASSHLSKLVEGKLVVVRKQGRHKYFQLQGVEVAELLEQLLNISSVNQHSKISTGPSDNRLRNARVCYDHLAGELGVMLYDSLLANDKITENNDVAALTAGGRTFFGSLGVNFNQFDKAKRPLCKSCLDWSERRSHLAGSIGQWVLTDIFSKGWAIKDLDTRAVQFTQHGLKQFCKLYTLRE